ncbi:LysR family transcriptional regulator [Streptomyces avicenniae]|uniref:LysR family transcriptional regulator n=1 Tax=Streptomyces avicenniae TaxID=500153 RepID=UPI00069B15EB|nr:LysR family transcriptional regulator [Streptomyces avicenniae]
MTPSELTVRELRVLVAVAGAGSFSGAAAGLGQTQSAVSHAVRGIEAKVGAVLFERGRGGARATAAGDTAVAHARRVLRLLDALPAEARAAGAGGAPTVAGPLRVAAFRSAALHLLPSALARLAERHPAVVPRVRMVREVGAGVAGEVLAGRADIGIATLTHADDDLPAGLVGGLLLREGYSLAHPAGHHAPRTLPLIDWAENCDSYTRDWWAAQDWLPHATVEAQDDGAVLSLVAQGHGMAILPDLSLTDAPPSVTVTDLGAARPTRGVGWVTTPELATTGAVRALVRALRAQRPART